jgi:hypothetical protein
MRLRIAEYFLVILKNTPTNILDINSEYIDEFLIKATDDKNQEVR